MDVRDVTAGVSRRFDADPAAGGRWSDPHEHRDVAVEEYSRVTRPERYALVGARTTAWIDTLVDLQLATAQAVDAPPWPSGPADPRAVLVTPATPGALPILVVRGSMEGVEEAVVALGVGDPAVLVAMQPDCGCDACDSGSDDLLSAIDEMFTVIVDGSFLHAEGEDWTLTVGVNGWSATGSEDFESLVDEARAGRSIGRRMITGAPWSS